MEVTPLLAEPRSTVWPVGAVHVEAGQCGGCGRSAELRWTMEPLDGPVELRGVIFVCRPCGRRVLVELCGRLPDLGPVPLRGYQ